MYSPLIRASLIELRDLVSCPLALVIGTKNDLLLFAHQAVLADFSDRCSFVVDVTATQFSNDLVPVLVLTRSEYCTALAIATRVDNVVVTAITPK